MEKMNRKCLYCYLELEETTEGDFHELCSVVFFGAKKAPLLFYSLIEMAELAKNVVQRSVAVPGALH